MTIGYFLVAWGLAQMAWMAWEIRHFDPNRFRLAQKIMADVLRRPLRPKSDLSVMLERSSYWVGLCMGPVIMSLGLVFVFSE